MALGQSNLGEWVSTKGWSPPGDDLNDPAGLPLVGFGKAPWGDVGRRHKAGLQTSLEEGGITGLTRKFSPDPALLPG